MKTVVIGGSFAGITAAIQVKRKLKEKAEVLLIDRNEDFLFIPSLIWVPTKRRELTDITIPRRQMLEKRGVQFVQAVAEKIDPFSKTIYTSK